MKIGIFHHQASEAGRISVMLARLGHRPVALNDGAAVLETVPLEHFDLLIMRWDGAELCGVAVMHRLQQQLDRVPPVLMLMTPDAPGGIAEAADAQIEEPVTDAALAAALASVMGAASGRMPPGSNDELQLVSAKQQVMVRGHAVQLTAKEYALAKLLLDSVGEALSRDRIMAMIWGRADQAGSRTLDAHIAQVRKRLSLHPEHGWRLSSVYGFGYRLDRVDG
jgi:DNA-binding response OmpR family regulator